MSCSAKMRKLSVRIDAGLKASFKDTLRGIGVDPTCAMRSFAFQIVLEGDIPFGPVDAGFEAGGGTAMTSVKIPEDVASEMESVLKGLGTNFSQAARLLALQTTALGGMQFAAGISADRHIPIQPISTGDAVHRTKQDTNRSGKLLQHHEVPRSLCPKHKRAVLLYELIR